MKRATLSFDNGPDPDVTPAVLDLLRRHAVTAHFFVLGKNLVDAAGRRLVARALEEGHRVGNHSFSHATPLGEDLRADAVEAEIVATEALLAALGASSRRFRPFGGGGVIGRHLLSRAAADYLAGHGYSCVLWSSVPRDWVDPEGWPARALSDCEEQEHAVVVLHDIPGACLSRLEPFLDAARARGIELVDDLPRACTPILDGRVVGDLDAIVAR